MACTEGLFHQGSALSSAYPNHSGSLPSPSLSALLSEAWRPSNGVSSPRSMARECTSALFERSRAPRALLALAASCRVRNRARNSRAISSSSKTASFDDMSRPLCAPKRLSNLCEWARVTIVDVLSLCSRGHCQCFRLGTVSSQASRIALEASRARCSTCNCNPHSGSGLRALLTLLIQPSVVSG